MPQGNIQGYFYLRLGGVLSFANLAQLFKPTSIAVIGASNEPGSPGEVVMRNLLQGRFLGPVMPISEKQEAIGNVVSYSSIDTLPITPDLAILCSPPETVPGYIEELGKRGTKAAVIISRGMFRSHTEKDEEYLQLLERLANQYGVRILGPNCLGFLNPSIGLNASLAHRDALPGKLAFVSQSDSLFTSVLDWATSKGIGFSHFLSLGDRSDINFGNILDYLNSDPHTRAVLLYIETIVDARLFMSAARATARNKPVLVLKAGRFPETAAAAAAHSGASLFADDVFDAAFRRAGMLRVFDIDTLFDTVETLAISRPPKGDRLAIITNGGSPGFLATDALMAGGGRLAELSPETLQEIDEALPGAWSYHNPLVIKSASPGETYGRALLALLKDQNVDAILAMHVPTAAVPSVEVAQAVIEARTKVQKVVLTSWLGIDDAVEARKMFVKEGIPTYFTPVKAVRAYISLVQYRRNQAMLMEVPPSLPDDFEPEVLNAREVVDLALNEERGELSTDEARQILAAYDIPFRPWRTVEGPEKAVQVAEELGYPVVLRLAGDASFSWCGGAEVVGLSCREDILSAAESLVREGGAAEGPARFTVQSAGRCDGFHELYVKAFVDSIFGPVVRFGQGGAMTEIFPERQVSLLPINMGLAHELVSRTAIHSLLQGFRGHPPVDMDALCLTLVKVAQVLVDVPGVVSVEIEPLLADQAGVLVGEARVLVEPCDVEGADRLAIRPYPRELEECAELKDGRRVTLRPIRPEDEPAHWEFLEHLSAEDKRFRFFGNIAELPRSEMIRFTQIDYDREMAFIAKGPDEAGEVRTLGVVRAMTRPDNSESEFAVAIRSDMKRTGMGRILMDKIIRYCKSRGTGAISGQGLLENRGMAGLAKAMGFTVTKAMDDDVFDFYMDLTS
jgi:acetyltransferase